MDTTMDDRIDDGACVRGASGHRDDFQRLITLCVRGWLRVLSWISGLGGEDKLRGRQKGCVGGGIPNGICLSISLISSS